MARRNTKHHNQLQLLKGCCIKWIRRRRTPAPTHFRNTKVDNPTLDRTYFLVANQILDYFVLAFFTQVIANSSKISRPNSLKFKKPTLCKAYCETSFSTTVIIRPSHFKISILAAWLMAIESKARSLCSVKKLIPYLSDNTVHLYETQIQRKANLNRRNLVFLHLWASGARRYNCPH